MTKDPQGFTRFFTRNLIQGLLFFAVFLIAFVFLRDWILAHYEQWLQPIADQPFFLYVVFFLNELIFGFIPPEVFMVIFLPQGTEYFINQIILMTILSYCGGFMAYTGGKILSNYPRLDLLGNFPKLAKWQPFYNKYGGLLIFAAAVTPIPFALVSLLCGWLKYPLGRYMLYGSLRFVRFVLYGYLFWLANSF